MRLTESRVGRIRRRQRGHTKAGYVRGTCTTRDPHVVYCSCGKVFLGGTKQDAEAEWFVHHGVAIGDLPEEPLRMTPQQWLATPEFRDRV